MNTIRVCYKKPVPFTSCDESLKFYNINEYYINVKDSKILDGFLIISMENGSMVGINTSLICNFETKEIEETDEN